MVSTLQGEYPENILAIVGSTAFHKDQLASNIAYGFIINYIGDEKPDMIISGGAVLTNQRFSV